MVFARKIYGEQFSVSGFDVKRSPMVRDKHERVSEARICFAMGFCVCAATMTVVRINGYGRRTQNLQQIASC